MKRFVKGALLFTGGVAGGFVLCGITTIKLSIKSDTFRTAVINKISDEVTTLIYGETRKSRFPNVSYTNVYRFRNLNDSYEDVVFETRADAEEVLSGVEDICKTYGNVTVSDLYDLCGLTGTFRDNQIGWSDLSTVSIMRTKDGYRINFPKPYVSYRSYRKEN